MEPAALEDAKAADAVAKAAADVVVADALDALAELAGAAKDWDSKTSQFSHITKKGPHWKQWGLFFLLRR